MKSILFTKRQGRNRLSKWLLRLTGQDTLEVSLVIDGLVANIDGTCDREKYMEGRKTIREMSLADDVKILQAEHNPVFGPLELKGVPPLEFITDFTTPQEILDTMLSNPKFFRRLI